MTKMPTATVLTKDELIAALQNEVRILLHLASKVDRSQLDYRPTPKQRSTIELLRYLSVNGPGLGRVVKEGKFDQAAWQATLDAVTSADFDQTLAAIEKQSSAYAEMLGGLSEADFREEIEVFGKLTGELDAGNPHVRSDEGGGNRAPHRSLSYSTGEAF